MAGQLLLDAAGLVVLIFAFGWSIYTLIVDSDVSEDVWFSLSAIGTINIIGLSIAVRRNRTIYTAIFYFNLVFFTFAPIQQLQTKFDPIFGDQETLSVALILMLMWCFACICGLLAVSSYRRVSRLNTMHELAWNENHPAKSLVPLWSLSVSATIVGFLTFGSNLFSDRDTAGKALFAQMDQVGGLILGGFLFPFAFYSAVVGCAIVWRRDDLAGRFAFAIALALALVLNNFMILSRYQFSVLIIAAIFFLSSKRLVGARVLLGVLALGTLLSPLFHIFRTSNSILVETADFQTFLSTMDYDAFSLICHTVKHVDTVGVDGGGNILSALLFFVPRGIWPGKYEITPYYLLDTLRAYRNIWSFNLSEPLIAEGYFALGYGGGVGITIVFLCLVNKIEGSTKNWLSAKYLFLCASPIILLMLLRGSLLVGMSIVVGHALAIFASIKLASCASQNKLQSSHF